MDWLGKIADKYLNEETREYNRLVDEVNKLSPQQLYDKLRSGECPNPVEHLLDVPLGMFHCGLCGTMVVAGCPHGPIDPPFDPTKSLVAECFLEVYGDLLVPDPPG